MSDAISTATKEICDCCSKLKMVKIYITQMGTTAWICKDCREGKKK